jgi:hypothetical protein
MRGFSFVCVLGGTLWHLQKLLLYIAVELTPSTILLYPSSPHCIRLLSVIFSLEICGLKKKKETFKYGLSENLITCFLCIHSEIIS